MNKVCTPPPVLLPCSRFLYGCGKKKKKDSLLKTEFIRGEGAWPFKYITITLKTKTKQKPSAFYLLFILQLAVCVDFEISWVTEQYDELDSGNVKAPITRL